MWKKIKVREIGPNIFFQSTYFFQSALSHTRPRGHKSEMVSLLISVSLSVKEYIEEKWDWDQKWDRLAFMAPEPDLNTIEYL